MSDEDVEVLHEDDEEMSDVMEEKQSAAIKMQRLIQMPLEKGEKYNSDDYNLRWAIKNSKEERGGSGKFY